MASVGGLNDVMVALANLGGLTQEAFADLQAQGVSAFQQMTAAGFTQEEALAALAPMLQTILKLHQERGLAIDAETQALIDQAVANGTLKEQISLQDVLIDGIGALIEAVGGKLPESFLKAKKAAEEAGKAVKAIPTKVKVDVDVEQPPPIEIEFNVPEWWKPGMPPPGAPENYHFARGGVVPHPRALAPLAQVGDAMPVVRPFYRSTGGAVPLVRPLYRASGAPITPLIDWRPRGTDTVPAMLTPKEGVVTVDGMERLGGDGLEALNRGTPMPPRILAKLAVPRLTGDLARAAALFTTLTVLPSRMPPITMPTGLPAPVAQRSFGPAPAIGPRPATQTPGAPEPSVTVHVQFAGPVFAEEAHITEVIAPAIANAIRLNRKHLGTAFKAALELKG